MLNRPTHNARDCVYYTLYLLRILMQLTLNREKEKKREKIKITLIKRRHFELDALTFQRFELTLRSASSANFHE